MLRIIFLFFFLLNNQVLADNKLDIKYFLEEKPYKIKGKWHYPKNNMQYNEIGIASVYKGKKEKKTKNGEFFSNKRILAKHKTLPLPTIVRVTNLKNGYSINVRINSRGPRNNYRIIELSKRAADFLDITNLGLVEVEIVPDLSFRERNKIMKINIKDNNENLEENIAIVKESIYEENLLDVKKKEKEENKNENVSYKKKKSTLNINFKKKNIQPYYLRIEIAQFKSFRKASNLKIKMKPIYDKILISLIFIDGQKYYKLTTKPINNLNEAEKLLSVINKKGFNNAKLFIDKKMK